MRSSFIISLVCLIHLNLHFGIGTTQGQTDLLCQTIPESELSGISLFSALPKIDLTNPESGATFPIYVVQPDTGLESFITMVLVPGGTGGAAGLIKRAEQLRTVGVLSILFDPDGRGLAEGSEDQGGIIHQAGLNEVIRVAAELACVNASYLGVFTNSYGITMGAGALANKADTPIKFLIDWEGPADRNDTGGCDESNTGHLAGWVYESEGETVTVTCDDEAFWTDREAATKIGKITVPYLRLQSREDHVQPDHAHSILMINRAIEGNSPLVSLNYQDVTLSLDGSFLSQELLLENSLQDLVKLVNWAEEVSPLQNSGNSVRMECALSQAVGNQTFTTSEINQVPSANSDSSQVLWPDTSPKNSLSSYAVTCDLPPQKALTSIEINSASEALRLPATSCKAKNPSDSVKLRWRESGLLNIDSDDILSIVCPFYSNYGISLQREKFDITLKASSVEDTEQSVAASAPIFITTMTHLEGNWDFTGPEGRQKFDLKVASLELAMDTFGKYGALLTIESEIPFSSAAIDFESDIFSTILTRGHGVGTHCDITPMQPLTSTEEFTEQFAERKVLVDALVGTENNLGCSGGQGQNDWVLGAHGAGFKFIDGIVGYAFLSMPLENRPEGWTNEYIIDQGHYHDNVPIAIYERIHPFMMEDATDFIADNPGKILLSAGGIGRLDGFAEEERGEACRPRCDFEDEDIHASFRRIDEALLAHDNSRIGKIDIYFPLSSFTQEKIPYIESFLSRLKNEYIDEGKLKWGTQRDVYEAYIALD